MVEGCEQEVREVRRVGEEEKRRMEEQHIEDINALRSELEE